MKKIIILISISFLGVIDVFGQSKVIKVYLDKQVLSITETPQFYEIAPQSDRVTHYQIPFDLQDTYTISRYLEFNSGKSQFKIPVLLGIDSLERTNIIIDKNLDFNFSNDKRQSLDTAVSSARMQMIEDSFVLSDVNSQKFHFKYIFKKPKFLSADYKSIVENRFFFMVASNNIFSKNWEAKTKVSKLIIYTVKALDYRDKYVRLAVSADTNSAFQFKKGEKFAQYKIGDSLFINGDAYCFKAFDAGAGLLTLEKLSAKKNFNAIPGFFAYEFNRMDINMKPVSLYDNAGNYTLLEFWGTWCVPCAVITPKLKELYNKYARKKLRVIGIAYDSDLKKVNEYIKTNMIEWPNIYQKMNSGQASLVDKFKVENYPTYILVEPSGKIIFKDYGIDGFQNLNRLIEKIELLK